MNKFVSTGGALALCLMSAACATHENSRMLAHEALANPTDSRGAEVAGASSAYWGDKWTAANLFERANTPDSRVLDRFNLAATYQATGRFAEAATLYRSVQKDGVYIRASGVGTNAERIQGTRTQRFNLADESTARLAYLDGMLASWAAPTPVAASEIRSAEAAGVQASAVVGTPIQGRVSDQTAIQRDQTAQPLK